MRLEETTGEGQTRRLGLGADWTGLEGPPMRLTSSMPASNRARRCGSLRIAYDSPIYGNACAVQVHGSARDTKRGYPRPEKPE
jgi:hypothetical protein